MTTATTAIMDPIRIVLENVRAISFEKQHDQGDVELTPFPSALKSCLEYLGETLAYDFLMGVSGAAFRLTWHPHRWDGANIDLILAAPDPLEPYRRAFSAVGYGYEIVGNRDVPHGASVARRFFSRVEGYESFRKRIIESIRERGRPAIGMGVVGPPECSIITGYDEGGDILIGWSYFQDMPEFNASMEFETSGYFRKRDWFNNTPGLILIGEKRETPPLKEVHREALEWALQLVRTPIVHEHRGGLAAYEAWAEDLTRDQDFPLDDMAVLSERMMAHDDAVTTVAEGRWYASRFLANMAGQEPGMASELLSAAACYATEHDLMWQLWGLVGGIGRSEVQIRKLAQPEVRRQMIPIIRQARDKDEAAADCIERTLMVA